MDGKVDTGAGQMNTKYVKIGLGLGAVCALAGVVVWYNQSEPEIPKTELELLAEEFKALNCPPPATAEELRITEPRTKEILGRMKIIVADQGTSEEMNQTQVEIMNLVKCPESE